MDGKDGRTALRAALELSGELAELIRAAWDATPAFNESRSQAAHGLCALSIEHGFAVQTLLHTAPASAIALVRPQYESLVRAVWVTHSANDAELNRLLAPLAAESQQAARKLPGVPKMLAALERSGPRGASALLSRARSRLGDGLNSFVHGGIHPFARQRSGYPIVMLIDTLKSSNALSILTLLVQSALMEKSPISDVVSALHESFRDVLPDLEPFDN